MAVNLSACRDRAGCKVLSFGIGMQHLGRVQVAGRRIGGVQVQHVQRLPGQRGVLRHGRLPPHVAAVQDAGDALASQQHKLSVCDVFKLSVCDVF
jgi:hypothetical protein